MKVMIKMRSLNYLILKTILSVCMDWSLRVIDTEMRAGMNMPGDHEQHLNLQLL